MVAKTLPDAGYLRQRFDYDPIRGTLLWRPVTQQHFARSYEYLRWNARYAGTRAGYIGTGEYPDRRVTIDGSDYSTARVIWCMVTGEDLPEVDHRDRDTLNDVWDNLRPATRSQNSCNRRRRRRLELPKGVYEAGKKFSAFASVNGKKYYLGVHDTPEEAHAAYCEAAKRLHGEFANFG